MSLISVTHALIILAIFQMSLSLHLNAHNINFCTVIYGCAYRETAMLNLIASPEMFETYFVPEETEGGPGQRTGKGATLSQQAETRRWLKWENRLVAMLRHVMHAWIYILWEHLLGEHILRDVQILREKAWKVCPYAE